MLFTLGKAAEKTLSCFALDTEHQYWTVKKVKKISMASNVLPLQFATSQASSSQKYLLSKKDVLRYCKT